MDQNIVAFHKRIKESKYIDYNITFKLLTSDMEADVNINGKIDTKKQNALIIKEIVQGGVVTLLETRFKNGKAKTRAAHKNGETIVDWTANDLLSLENILPFDIPSDQMLSEASGTNGNLTVNKSGDNLFYVNYTSCSSNQDYNAAQNVKAVISLPKKLVI